jgi:molecular chaperone GrpE (heat shock protein)
MPTKSNIELPEEFASAMQQLVAEAEKKFPSPNDGDAEGYDSLSATQKELAAVNDRLAAMEKILADAVQKLATPPDNGGVTAQLRKIDDHLMALRNTESVNHRLFNTLHQELKTYRDNFMRDSLQKPFIRDLIVLHDDLSGLATQMQSASGSGDMKLGQWCDNLDNSLHALLEIMHRLEVKEIEPAEMVDRTLHKVVSYEPADFAEEDGRIMMRLRRGFKWRDQVLRPEEVVAKRFG